ncbi:MAG: ribosome maturation factor RimP [Methylococcaceae bacterium]|jgi:ribosome maturation factor RimP
MKAHDRLVDMLKPVVEGLGYEWVGIEFDGHQRVLRIYIDTPDGVKVDDCSRVSYQVSGVLDVEDPMPGRYQLEVSSPGMDRPLFALEHFERFKGQMVRLQLTRALDGRRRFKARLQGVDDRDVLLQDEQVSLRIPFDLIDKARLSPEFDH